MARMSSSTTPSYARLLTVSSLPRPRSQAKSSRRCLPAAASPAPALAPSSIWIRSRSMSTSTRPISIACSRSQRYEAVLDAYPDWTIPAHVIAIIPTADRGKATVKVRVALEQKDPRILPDMGVSVSFLEAAASAAAWPQRGHGGACAGDGAASSVTGTRCLPSMAITPERVMVTAAGQRRRPAPGRGHGRGRPGGACTAGRSGRWRHGGLPNRKVEESSRRMDDGYAGRNSQCQQGL